METLKNKIDFSVVFSVKGANPNGDPLNGNRPRINYEGIGEVSDVCIKRKIRNRLMEAGYSIFVQSDDNRMDNYRSLRSRVEGELKEDVLKDEKRYREEACKKWIDVRAFGQVFAFKSKDNKKGKKTEDGEEEKAEDKGVSIGIRGPVSVHSAFSVIPIGSSTSSIQITKSVSNEDDSGKKSSDTMGMKHRVDDGIYIFHGAANPQLALKTGFSDRDAKAIKEVLEHLFDNDSSSARPEGSMEIQLVIWWQHNCPIGQYSSAIVHRSLNIEPKKQNPKGIEDYQIKLRELSGLKPEIFNSNKLNIEYI
ncbi:MAG: type I-C CRISPR-associated protein Cas7/Csd2 [Actinobacteria bacterium]|nr:type I-C CRISPR-associated protein Cas7/Csd2 [Actinomycetota bacterium]